ncbi:MAG: tetratricopeptide repeat protein [Candidatus Thiodiazotropha sp. (ex Lucina aurantia)]|nr:tetratricopeptide repeat protein [Candidatus Thiodiazotropha taylori]MBV2098699.1 tetratricopeptide repeat protein [Candidatus Thiodiazotropha sp. (ex Codakia orbicularis)]MBV2103725.1 tetratricopeptide repeat protein [Candidatus Thiodiazotropha sp. (ex Lucina aurantia)]MBV2118164.1 tetratricopeptide repeat protein [Candidatus Thiodiazotropha sp. (ex Lucina aurantia)]
MSEYQTEEEQVEAIKRWWKENGTSVIAGLVIGLGGVFGWQAWGNYKDRIGAEAALAFNQMVAAVDRGDKSSAVKQAELMRSNYDNSYAIFAAMAEARVKLDQGDAATAISRLEWASENADNPSLKQLVQLSLARVLLNEGELDAAEKQVASEQGGFAGEFAVIRGDIAFARGDKAAAAEAYTQAMTLEVSNRNLLQMKLDDLAATTP